MKYIYILFAIICASSFIGCRQAIYQGNSKKYFSKKEIEEDFNDLTNTIETKVPYPFYNCPKEQYDSIKRYTRTHIPDSASLNGIYKVFYPLVQTLNDAHFSLHLPDNFFSETTRYFPFKVLIVGNRLFVKENLSNEKRVEKGNEIISINSIPVTTILATIRSCNSKLPNEETFFEVWNEPVFYKRLFTLFDLSDTFNIVLSNGLKFTIVGISEKSLKSPQTGNDKPEFKILDNNIGYLKIPSLIWNNEKERETFDRFIDSAFLILQSAKSNKLIVDIRNNPGGSSILAKDILDHISFKPYTLSKGEVDKEQNTIKEELDTSLHSVAAHINRFNGSTILLNNSLTYSSAHMMQVGFQYYKMGQTMGEISSEPLFITGEVHTDTLKKSHLTFHYPTSNFILPGFNKDKKTYYTPTVIYKPTLGERLSDQDILLKKAISVFKK